MGGVIRGGKCCGIVEVFASLLLLGVLLFQRERFTTGISVVKLLLPRAHPIETAFRF